MESVQQRTGGLETCAGRVSCACQQYTQAVHSIEGKVSGSAREGEVSGSAREGKVSGSAREGKGRRGGILEVPGRERHKGDPGRGRHEENPHS